MTIDMAANKVMFTSEKDCWETPQWLFDDLNEELRFTLDYQIAKKTGGYLR